MTKYRCEQDVVDNKKKRKCKRKKTWLSHYCIQHHISNNAQYVGTCYMCNDDCNPCSQVCGRCARTM